VPARKQAAGEAVEQTPENGPEISAGAVETEEDSNMPGSVPATPPEPPRPVPPYYIAREPLFVGGLAGTMPVRAFVAGDHVPADLVEPNGWAGMVDYPDAPAPQQDMSAALAAGKEQTE
jgi:hypothetical protein